MQFFFSPGCFIIHDDDKPQTYWCRSIHVSQRKDSHLRFIENKVNLLEGVKDGEKWSPLKHRSIHSHVFCKQILTEHSSNLASPQDVLPSSLSYGIAHNITINPPSLCLDSYKYHLLFPSTPWRTFPFHTSTGCKWTCHTLERRQNWWCITSMEINEHLVEV